MYINITISPFNSYDSGPGEFQNYHAATIPADTQALTVSSAGMIMLLCRLSNSLSNDSI